MKGKFLYFIILIPLIQGCVANEQTGEMETSWLFWVFFGLLMGGLFLGAITSLLKKKKPEDAPTEYEKEIEAYEETLEHKLNETSSDSEHKLKEHTSDSEKNKESEK